MAGEAGTDLAGWLPVATLILGYLAKSFEDWVQYKRTVARERETRLEARRDQRAVSRIAFQRDTLLQLQDAMQKLSRATGRARHLDYVSYRTTNVWRMELLPADLDEEILASQTQTSLLSSRVRDDRVRELVDALKSRSADVLTSSDEASASHSMLQMMDINNELHGRIGELIRSIDDDDDSGRVT